MKMYIHSIHGVLECEPMTLQAIEKSIPESHANDNIGTEVMVDVGPVDAVCCDNPGNVTDQEELQQ